MNTVTASFDTTARQTTEMSQKKKDRNLSTKKKKLEQSRNAFLHCPHEGLRPR